MLTLGLDLGRDLGTRRLSWRRLRVICEQLPTTSALFRARNPESWRWGLTEQLLAIAGDALNLGNWMRSKDGSRNANRPKPIDRPGVSKPEERRFGTTVMGLAEADAWLAGEGVTYADLANDLLM